MKTRDLVARIGHMTPAERQQGRFMRAPDHPQGGGDDTGSQGAQQQQTPPVGENNPNGNGGDSNASGGNQNNDGQSFDPEAFWNDPNAEGSGDSSQEPDNSGQQTGQQIVAAINDFRVDPIFNQEAAQQISEGNFDAVNESIQAAMQNTMRQTLGLAARIMQDFERSMQGQIQGAINQNQTKQTDEQLLSENFSTYAKPAMQPMIRGVFNQALKHSGNDRTKALQLTRNMLQTMGQIGGSDFGFENPPAGPDDFQSEGPSSLVKDLLAMR